MTATYSDLLQKLTPREKTHLALFPEQIAAIGLRIRRYGGPNRILILRSTDALRSGRLKIIE